MASVVFLSGGCRSGKSDFAVQLAQQSGSAVAMLVPCAPVDDEMRKRIKQHRALRPAAWPVYEEALDPGSALSQIQEEVIVLDCLTAWIGNLLVHSNLPEAIETKILDLLSLALGSSAKTIIVVSAEVGLGLVPDNLLGREFSDLVGFANRRFVERAQQAYFLVCGVPLNLKQLSTSPAIGTP